MADKIINISIYFTYLVIASVSVVISYKVSIVMSLIVLAIECVRMMSIYKKAYAVIVLVFILNTFLIGYNGQKSQSLIEYNNAQIIASNSKTEAYLQEKKTILSANKFASLKSEIRELQNASVDWWLLVGVYIFLELSLILLIIKINKQEKQVFKPKLVKKEVIEKKDTLNGNEEQVKPTEIEEKLEYIGSVREWMEIHEKNRYEAKKQFDTWKAKGLLVKKDKKNYLKKEN